MRRMFGVLVAVVALGGCGIDSTGDSSSPLIEITSPILQIVRGNVTFSANVLDDTGVASVQFLADGDLLLDDDEAPYATSWDASGLAEGSQHTLRVVATDLAGNMASLSKVVTVNNSAPNLRGGPAQR